MPFKKGQSGNPKGRTPGVPDRVSQEARTLARSLFDKAYWTRTKAKLLDGSLAPAIEAKLLAYAFGEPKQEHAGQGGIIVNIGFLDGQQRPTLDVVATTQVMPPQARVALLE